ncbi:MAG: hypothetical protein ACI9BW_002139 [Gammaproteobacteria bacterium]|jgi:hypothetical protein
MRETTGRAANRQRNQESTWLRGARAGSAGRLTAWFLAFLALQLVTAPHAYTQTANDTECRTIGAQVAHEIQSRDNTYVE